MLGKSEGRENKGATEIRWLDGIADRMDMNLRKLQQTVEEGEAWCAESMRSQSQTRLSD